MQNQANKLSKSSTTELSSPRKLTLTQRIVMAFIAVAMLLGSLGPIVQSYMQ